MDELLSGWADAALTTLGFFWMAFWAFCLGYLISSSIRVFVTRERMRRTMGRAGAGSVALATFFGFISSSCSFAALATSKSLFQKGAGLVPALAFLLASTNLVIELGILISMFLSWQFVAAEYIGGDRSLLRARSAGSVHEDLVPGPAEYVSWLGLDPSHADPISILSVSGGNRVTDNLELIQSPGTLRTISRNVSRLRRSTRAFQGWKKSG